MGPTLLALHAHPDDESSKGAGTVARYSDEGVRAVLVTATGGEAGDILNPAMERPEVKERLAEVRRAELAEAARIIGFHRVELLGYRDSGMPGSDHNAHPDAFVNVPFEEALGKVVAIIRAERPQVVIGYDEHRRYPHPDHLRIHELGLAAFEAAADPGRFPEAGPPWEVARLFAPYFTLARLHALDAAMRAHTGDSPLGEWLERRGEEPDPAVVVQVPVGDHLARARQALLAHRTQIDPAGGWFEVPEHIVRAAYPYEDFVVMASRGEPVPGGPGDLFAGLGLSRTPQLSI